MKDYKTIGLFGCNTEKDWVGRYEKILLKILVEDKDFFEREGVGIDANDFNLLPEMKLIVGTYKDMYVRDGIGSSYDQLRAELNRKYGEDEIRVGIINEIIDDVRDLALSDEEMEIYKNQVRDWKNFTVATKIMNLWMDFLKSDIRNGDRDRMYSVMKRMRAMSALLPEFEIKKAPKNWN